MAGRAWTRSEENKLIDELAAGMKLDEISLSHDRTQGAIRSRQRLMATNFYINGMKLNEIAIKCRLPESQVEATLMRRKLVPQVVHQEPLEY